VKRICIGTLNIGTMTGKGHELVDFMERRKVDVLCVQETKWKGQKSREIGNGFKMFYCGTNTRRNGVGIILDDTLKKDVLMVKRKSDRIIWLKILIGDELINVMSVYAPQTGCDETEKTEFWEDLIDELAEIPSQEQLWIGGDFNGHVGCDNVGKEQAIGQYGIGICNEEGETLLDFAIGMDLVVCNTLFKKAERHRITYKSGGAATQIDYVLCRKTSKRSVRDCKVILGESVATQHRPVLCRINFTGKSTNRRAAAVPKIRWWKLKDKEQCKEFITEATKCLTKRQEDLSDSWENVSQDIRDIAKQSLGMTSGKNKPGKETWWWNEDVQKAVKAKKQAKKAKDQESTEENADLYKQRKREAKKAVATAKAEAYKKLYEDLDTTEGQKQVLRMAKKKDRDSKDIYQAKLIKNKEGETLFENDKILQRWHDYFRTLMNEENPREERIDEQNRMEVDIEEISKEEILTAMKRMKTGKAVGPDNIPVEVWKCMGTKGLVYLTKMFRKIMEEEQIPDDWRKSILIPIYKNKGDILNCGNYRGIKLMSHTMKLLERVVESRMRDMVNISREQFGFMKGRSTVDAIFALRQLQEKYREGQSDLHAVFIDLEKAYDRVPREELFWCMRDKVVPEKYIRLVQDMYTNSQTAVSCAAGTSQLFPVEVGLHQGSALSPFLFAIIMDSLTNTVREESPWQMMFADDVVLCATSKDTLEEALEKWRKALESRGLKLSRSKTEYMCLHGEQLNEISLGDTRMPRVDEFKYLGSTITNNGTVDKEIKKRTEAGWRNWKKMTGVLCDKKVPINVKGKIHKTIVQPAMTYAMETVSLTSRQEKKLEVAEMKMCRWACGWTRLDRVRNETVRERLKVEKITDRVRRSRLRWFGHVERRDENYVGRRTMNMAIPGKRKRGRPRKRWRDNIKEDLEAIGAKREDAKDRERWRRLTAPATLQ